MKGIAVFRIVLSGPKSSVPQLKTAFKAAGLSVTDEGDSHGLPEAKRGHTFVTVRSGDVERVVKVADGLGWQLRLHGVDVEGGRL